MHTNEVRNEMRRNDNKTNNVMLCDEKRGRNCEVHAKSFPVIRMLIPNPSPLVAPSISDLIFIVVPRAEVYVCYVWAVQSPALIQVNLTQVPQI